VTRLFSAFPLPDAVSDHLAAHLRVNPPLRAVPREQWHVTVGYHGADDPEARLRSLRDRVTGLAAPELRLNGSGTFSAVALLVVEDRTPNLAAVAEAAEASAGGHPEYSPHVTVARWPREAGGEPGRALAAELAGYRGPWWTPSELVLYASEGGRYTPLDQVRLRATG